MHAAPGDQVQHEAHASDGPDESATASKARSGAPRFPSRWLVTGARALVQGWGRTIRLTSEVGAGFVRDRIWRGGGNAIIGFWHDRLLYATHYLSMRYTYRQRLMSVLVSSSGDGAWIGAIISQMRSRVAWGSSTRGGLIGARELLRDVRAGYSPVITLDGPLGPRHVAKPGAVTLAAATGLPIVPLTFRFGSAWTLARTWDLTVVPRPWTSVRVLYGAPVFIDRDADPAHGLAALQASMDHVTQHAERGAQLTPIGARWEKRRRKQR